MTACSEASLHVFSLYNNITRTRTKTTVIDTRPSILLVRFDDSWGLPDPVANPRSRLPTAAGIGNSNLLCKRSCRCSCLTREVHQGAKKDAPITVTGRFEHTRMRHKRRKRPCIEGQDFSSTYLLRYPALIVVQCKHLVPIPLPL